VPGARPGEGGQAYHQDIIALLHREIVKILALPDMKERLAALGYGPIAGTPEEFATRIKAELGTRAKVIHAANIRPD
jgi:tripartite-type tricarboxylate transporter receptor subunit TctC